MSTIKLCNEMNVQYELRNSLLIDVIGRVIMLEMRKSGIILCCIGPFLSMYNVYIEVLLEVDPLFVC